ncbi:MAG: hypothetical protein ACR2K6_04830 [Solirubrobacterales bacterium]
MNRRLLELALLIAAGGAVTMMLGPFSGLLELIGLGVLALGIVLAAPATREGEAEWWTRLVVAAGVGGAGIAISLLSDTLGGLVTLGGAVAALALAVLALPER